MVAVAVRAAVCLVLTMGAILSWFYVEKLYVWIDPSSNKHRFVIKDYHSRSSEGFAGNDPSLGRRLSGGDGNWKSNAVLLQGLRNEQLGKTGSFKGAYVGKRNALFSKHVKSIAKMLAFVGLLFMLDSFLVSVSDSLRHESVSTLSKSDDVWMFFSHVDRGAYSEEAKPVPVQMYGRLLSMASSALAEKEFEQETRFWSELHVKAREWKPCADRKVSNKPGTECSFPELICNAVAVASLLNATLVLPTFLYSNVWKDPSQFGDIYQEKYFFDMMKDEVDIVKELPDRFKSLNIEAIGSLV
ncbi:O-fucosyltransferase 8 [Linum perenne]